MTIKSMAQRFTTYDAFVVAIVLAALGTIGTFIYWSDPAPHRAYVTSLLEFGLMEDRLAQDLYRLQLGELTNYDSLVTSGRALRTLELSLKKLPPHVEDSVALNEVTNLLADALHDKLETIQDFKTTLALLRVGTDNLPALARDVSESGTTAEVSQDFLENTLDEVLVFLTDPSPRHKADIDARLGVLNEHLTGAPQSDLPSPLAQFTRATTAIVNNKLGTVEQLRLLSGTDADVNQATTLNSVYTQLSYIYHMAHQQSRIRAIFLVSALLTAMVVLFVFLIYVTRWRALRQEVFIAEKQQALATALKDARARTDTMRKDGAEEATTLAEERLSALLRNTFETIAIVSREENYIFVSPTVIRMLGLSDKELIGRSIYEGIHADDLIRVKDYFTRAQKELQTEQTISYRLMDARGKWHMVETFASNQYSNPAIRGMVLNTRRLESVPAPV